MTLLLISSDIQWDFLQKLFKRVNINYIEGSDRLFFEGVLFRIRTGTPWHDLPSELGYWNTLYKRFNRWTYKQQLLSDISLKQNLIITIASNAVFMKRPIKSFFK